MKLKELTGYKNLPAHKAITDLDTAKGDDGDTTYNSDKMKTVEDKLAELNWHSVGSGMYATVFSNPTKPYVLKIFQEDYGYESYINIIHKNKGNPHVPVLYGKGMPVKITPKVSAIRMEKLQPITEKAIASYLAPDYEYNFSATIEDIFSEENEEYLMTNFPDLYKLEKQIARSNANWDMHEGNVMLRGNVMVIIDPLA